MHSKHLLSSIYAFATLFLFHGFLLLYVTSSVLRDAVGERWVGLVYSTISFAAIIAILSLPRILKGIGDYRATLASMALALAALIGIAFSTSPALTVALIMLHAVLVATVLFDIDILLETETNAKNTGQRRGAFITLAHVALIGALVCTGFILGPAAAYERLFAFAAAMLVPAIILFLIGFRHFSDPPYRPVPLRSSLKELWADTSLRSIVVIDFLLRFFYAWMVIYMPIYLHGHIGLSWSAISAIFIVMLVPFVLLEIPLGRLADGRWGEKEFLITGLLVMGAATALLPFIQTASVLAWAAALFATRVGAAMVEGMSEAYFFKRVEGRESPLISVFRIIGPAAHIVAPLLASLLLLVIPLRLLFLPLSALILFSLFFAARLRDTA